MRIRLLHIKACRGLNTNLHRVGQDLLAKRLMILCTMHNHAQRHHPYPKRIAATRVDRMVHLETGSCMEFQEDHPLHHHPQGVIMDIHQLEDPLEDHHLQDHRLEDHRPEDRHRQEDHPLGGRGVGDHHRQGLRHRLRKDGFHPQVGHRGET